MIKSIVSMVHLPGLSNFLDAYLRIWLLYALVYLRNSFVTSAINLIVAFIPSDDECLGRRLEFTLSCVVSTVSIPWLGGFGCGLAHREGVMCVTPSAASHRRVVSTIIRRTTTV